MLSEVYRMKLMTHWPVPLLVGLAFLAGNASGGPLHYDPGTFFVADGNVTHYDKDGVMVNSFAGVNGVFDITINPKNGDIYATRPGNSTIYLIDKDTGASKEVPNYFFDQPSGAAFAPNEWLYVTDPGHDAILEVMTDIPGLDPLVIRSDIGAGYLDNPQDLVFSDAGILYVTSGINQIARFSSTFSYLGAWTINSGILENPGGLTLGPDGTLYVVSKGTQSVLKIDSATGQVLQIYGGGEENPLTDARNVAVSPFTGQLLVADMNEGIVAFDLETGEFNGIYPTGGAAAVVAVVPEPLTAALIGIGLGGFAYRRHRRITRAD